MTLLKAVTINVRRKGSIADSTLQKIHREAGAMYVYIYNYIICIGYGLVLDER